MTLYSTQDELDELIKDNREVQFPSSLGFLNSHNGFRRGCIHMVLGTTGGGKSTLTRTLIKDFLYRRENQNKTLCLWLSEEGVKEYKAMVAYSMPSTELLYNTIAESEDDNPGLTEDDFFKWLSLFRPDVFIFDNITTSNFYEDKTPRDQGQFCRRLKVAVKEINCACIILAHTGAGVDDTSPRLIVMNDIMGGKSINRKAHFYYILQRFQSKGKFLPTIRILKHRSQDLVHGAYRLIFDHQKKIFSKDEAIDFEQLKKIFTERDKI